jgi:hypothetical protein
MIGKEVKSLFDEFQDRPIKLEPLSSVVYEKYLNDFVNFKFDYKSFNINEIEIVKKEGNKIFVDIYKLFNFCISSILIVEFDFNTISGNALLKSAINDIGKQIKEIEEIFKYNNVISSTSLKEKPQNINYSLNLFKSNNIMDNRLLKLNETDRKLAISDIRSLYLDLIQISNFFNQVEILINTKDAMEVKF